MNIARPARFSEALMALASANGRPARSKYQTWRLLRATDEYGGFGFVGVGEPHVEAFSPDALLDVGKWLAEKDWLAHFLQHPIDPDGESDLGVLSFEEVKDELGQFLTASGDLEPLPYNGRGQHLIELDQLLTQLARMRLALRTAMAFESQSSTHLRSITREWETYWKSDGWTRDIGGRREFPQGVGEPPYPTRLRRRLIRLVLASWASVSGIQARWPFSDTESPLEPSYTAETPMALVYLTCALSAGAVKARGIVETLGVCDECGAMFVADRRRKRGGETLTFCSTKCGNRNRARRFRASQSKTRTNDAK